MKTISTLIVFLTFTHFGFTQSVISDIVPSFGAQMVYNQAEDAPDPGASGANVIWDFSDFPVDDYSANYVVTNPDDVEGSDQFPDATMAWVVDLDFMVLNSFMSFANNAFTDYGSISTVSGITNGRVYDNPEVHFTYPLHYQDTGNDTYDGIVLSVGSENPITGESSYIVDGYGTLITPSGTYENVLRVTSTKVENLTSFGVEMTSNITETSWYSPDYPVPVYVMSSSVETYMGSPVDSSSTATALVSYTGAPVGITKVNPDNRLELYPNPVSDYIQLSADFQGVADMHIYSLDGKLVLHKSVNSTEKIDLTNLQSGGYMVLLTVNGAPYAHKPFIIR